VRIIGVLGRDGVGKRTVGKLVVELTGGQAITFADPVRELASLVFELDSCLDSGGPAERRIPSVADSLVRGRVRERIASEEMLERVRALLPTTSPDEAVNAWRRLQDAVETLLEEAEANGCLTAERVLQGIGRDFGRAVNENIWVAETFRRAERLLAEGAPVVVITDCRTESEAKAFRRKGRLWHVLGPITGPKLDMSAEPEVAMRYASARFFNDGPMKRLRHNVEILLRLENLLSEGTELRRCG
jgi:hypothetical protein